MNENQGIEDALVKKTTFAVKIGFAAAITEVILTTGFFVAPIFESKGLIPANSSFVLWNAMIAESLVLGAAGLNMLIRFNNFRKGHGIHNMNQIFHQ